MRKAARRDLARVVPTLGVDLLLDTAVNDTLGRIRSEAVITELDAETVRLGEEKQRALRLHYRGSLSESDIAAELDRIATAVKQTERKKELQFSRQRNRIVAKQLREFLQPDMADAVMDLQGIGLSRISKLVYKAFVVDAVGQVIGGVATLAWSGTPQTSNTLYLKQGEQDRNRLWHARTHQFSQGFDRHSPLSYGGERHRKVRRDDLDSTLAR